MTKIDPSMYLQNQQTRGSTGNTLGKDDFLKILMAQIQNQNPLDPMKDKEFISQMTEFSSLEQTTNMASAIQSLTESQQFSPVVEHSTLIGKEVTYPVYDEQTGEVAEQKSSIVQAVSQKDQSAQLELEDGNTVMVNDIIKVSNVATED
ncbi:flagellar hook assembly protein FlgD [Thalassobacillus sp. CUG 92003]|uniref:flagellar hook assembly protein FlgD n=1 Tax=Thalassobacillus sp. CUG 92003 TaxID=2736641 RepID=UPI0015E68441|nr:flagellar hook assembly protein FlgD [Thalassobacillus sp. CUG 92003]